MEINQTHIPEPELTIVIPVFNEQECLEKLYQVLLEYLQFTPMATVVMFVDDGSTDDSLSIIKNICQRNPLFGYQSLKKNAGLSTALKVGIDTCKSLYLGYMDADLQTSPKEFMSFLHYLPQYAMVNGIRANRLDSHLKRISSKIANRFRRLMIGDGIDDSCCPIKIMETQVVQSIPFFKGMHRFLPALIQLAGGKVKQVEVKHFPRYAGKAKYHLFNRLLNPFLDTLALAWMKKRMINYEISEVKWYRYAQLTEVITR